MLYSLSCIDQVAATATVLTQNGNFVKFKEYNLLFLTSCVSGNVVENDLLQRKRISFREFLHNQQAINFGASSTCAMTEKNRFRTDDFLEKLNRGWVISLLKVLHCKFYPGVVELRTISKHLNLFSQITLPYCCEADNRSIRFYKILFCALSAVVLVIIITLSL